MTDTTDKQIDKKLNICTLNICTWNIASCSTLVNNVIKHVDNIVDIILNRDDIDVWCLQEAFGSWYVTSKISNNKYINRLQVVLGQCIGSSKYIDIKDILMKKCIIKYPYMYKSKKISQHNILKCKNDVYDSGLLILSRYHIRDPNEYVYKETYDLGQKSFLHCTINDINIATTHLIPEYGSLKNIIRRKDQLDALCTFTTHYNDVVICGDLNINYETDKDTYNWLINTHKLIDANMYSPLKYTFNGLFNGNTKQSQILDYIFVRNYKTDKFKVLSDIKVSDHYPVISTIIKLKN